VVDEVDGLPGIVYIDATVAVPRGLDGALLHRVVGSRDLPILRVQLRWNLSAAGGIATLAHELQHVVEVLRVGQTFDCSGMRLIEGNIRAVSRLANLRSRSLLSPSPFDGLVVPAGVR
jgi:hypothetical protein